MTTISQLIEQDSGLRSKFELHKASSVPICSALYLVIHKHNPEINSTTLHTFYNQLTYLERYMSGGDSDQGKRIQALGKWIQLVEIMYTATQPATLLRADTLTSTLVALLIYCYVNQSIIGELLNVAQTDRSTAKKNTVIEMVGLFSQNQELSKTYNTLHLKSLASQFPQYSKEFIVAVAPAPGKKKSSSFFGCLCCSCFFSNVEKPKEDATSGSVKTEFHLDRV